MSDRVLDVRTDELMVVLNALHDEGAQLAVRYPFYDVNLFHYDSRKGEIVQSVDEATFEAAREKRVPKTQRLSEDLATWTDFRDVLLSSGARRYENHDEVAEELRRELENVRRANNPNPTFLAFDTNTLYHRLGARGLRHHFLGSDVHSFRFVVSQGVAQELSGAIAAKYAENDIRTIRAKVMESRRASALLNRTMKKGRKAKAASGDVAYLEAAFGAPFVDCDPLTEDKEKNDRLIAESYGRFRAQHDVDVVLLTSDANMEHHAQTERLRSVLLRVPPVAEGIPRGPMDETVVCRLVHDLAVAFGVVHLSGLDMRVWGEWSGKTLPQWRDEVVRVEFNPESRVADALQRDVACARALREVVSSGE